MKIPVIYDKNHKHHSPLTYPSPVGLEEYPEKPSRAEAIFQELKKQSWAEIQSYSEIDTAIITHVHTDDYISFLQSLETKVPDKAYYYPTEIIYSTKKAHPDFRIEMGNFSFDLSAPIDRYIYKQAVISAACAYTAAKVVHGGSPVAYSLSRPPGHHAMKNKMGGFCYINNSAVAAHFLSQFGKVAILDIDYHHGNGTQDIFYTRADVLTVSIHADPQTDYPYNWGYSDETGEGAGAGFNINYPLPHGITNVQYQPVLEKAVQQIQTYNPEYLVIPFGLDTYIKDPLGTFKLTTDYYKVIAQTIKKINVPTVIIQEGGYYIEDLGKNTASFLASFL